MSVRSESHDTESTQAGTHPRSIALLLAQLGAHAATRFAERVAEVGLTPPTVGILRTISKDPGGSQQQLAARLGLLPSKMVALIDELESRGLVERERSTTDRRQYALHLTAAGHSIMRRVGTLTQAHNRDLTHALDPDERETLAHLLTRIAEQQGLTPGVHPGYKAMT